MAKKSKSNHNKSNIEQYKSILSDFKNEQYKNIGLFNVKASSNKLTPIYKGDAEVGVINLQHHCIYPPYKDFKKLFTNANLILIKHPSKKSLQFVFSKRGKSLWCFFDEKSEGLVNTPFDKLRLLGLKNWEIANKFLWQKLSRLADTTKTQYLITSQSGVPYQYWKTPKGFIDIKNPDQVISEKPKKIGIGLVNKFFMSTKDVDIYKFFAERALHLDIDGQMIQPRVFAENTALEDMYNWVVEQGFSLTQGELSRSESGNLTDQFKQLDYTPCRLPKLNQTQLTDPDKGLWELYGEAETELKQLGLVARDPALDIQRRSVTIDFGTSSTVVAVATSTGGKELLRIGVRDFFSEPQPSHFENPTVLEFLDFASFTKQWQSTAYRPALNWDWVRASHEAQASFRDNPGDTEVLASVLPHLKQWALRSTDDRRIKLTGRKGKEMELEPHSERNPVRGQPLQVSGQDPLDPVELYAWYLGMTINWRERGLFLKYFLSFPVKYPREVKERILASFRRGLQRSLPQTLIDNYPQVLNDFTVSDLASEPAAYAAAALPFLKIEPTVEGVPYAVFDFGGGTSDFDFGLMRDPTEDEEDQGYETVFEHLGSGGDNFLGAENLLQHLVYETFKHNQAELRQKKIQFTAPMDARNFSGSEMLLANSQAAQTNTIMLAAKLRSFMEDEKPSLASQLRIDLIDSNGNKQACELALDSESLDNLLRERIHQGVKAFFSQLGQLLPQMGTDKIHVLLAGNGSRSRYISELFKDKNKALNALLGEVFSGTLPQLTLHQPLSASVDDLSLPTSKTGVALGLLELTPGSGVLMLNSQLAAQDGQAPFLWNVGKSRRRKFEVVLDTSAGYGQWQELGILQQGAFKLYATKSPRAQSGMEVGDVELSYHELHFPAATPAARLFARAVNPNTIQLGYAETLETLEETAVSELVLD